MLNIDAKAALRIKQLAVERGRAERFTVLAAEFTEPQCHSCKHWHEGTLTCDAFPGGIPVGFFTGRFDHRKPYPGDNGIRYEAAE